MNVFSFKGVHSASTFYCLNIILAASVHYMHAMNILSFKGIVDIFLFGS